MIDKVKALINQEYRRLGRLTVVGLVLLLLLQTIGSYFLFTQLWQHSFLTWFREIFVATIVLFFVGIIALYTIYSSRISLMRETNKTIANDLHVLKTTNERFEALQTMASTLSATLSFESVVEQAVGVCGLALEDLGADRHSFLGVVFLFDGDNLVPLTELSADQGKGLAGEEGVVGEALRRGEPAVTDSPHHDPELKEISIFMDCLTVVCVPLRAGYHLFGAMLLGIDRAVRFEEEHYDLFSAVADQTVIALQNAQLYQHLEEERHRLIEADVKARQELARDLHDGPVQKIAAIAMHLNVLKSMAVERPEKIPGEIEKLEVTAKNASQELRDMLFTLRPLLLDSKGLGAAIDSYLRQISERDGLETMLTGGESGNTLNRQAQNVVFSIAEEALSNARKHARATKIEAHLWQETDLFIMEIVDDGLGFDLLDINENYDTRGSLGMINMRERAERIDASLQFESEPGAGTTITLVVPLTKNGHPEKLELETAYSSQ